jgi:flagellar protein FlaG
MNTDLVQSLMSTATKTASSTGNPSNAARAQNAATSVAQDPKASSNTEAQIVPPTQKVQETVKAVAAQIESYLRSVGREVQFSIDSDSGETIITIRDSSTGELVRQIPSAEALRLSQALADRSNMGPSLVDTIA